MPSSAAASGVAESVWVEGSWWYNGGRSQYEIFSGPSGALRYFQRLGDGSELVGEFVMVPPEEGSAWTHEASLSNGASIRLRLGSPGRELLSSYRRAGSSEWRPPVVARRGLGGAPSAPPPSPAPPAPPALQGAASAAAAAALAPPWGARGLPDVSNTNPMARVAAAGRVHRAATAAAAEAAARGSSPAEVEAAGRAAAAAAWAREPGAVEAQPQHRSASSSSSAPAARPRPRQAAAAAPPRALDVRALASRLRETALGVFRERDPLVAPEFAALAGADGVVFEALSKASSSAGRARASPLDLLSVARPPLISSFSEEALEAHRARLREKASVPDPKTTIPPVPAARLGLGLVAHPVSYNEEQMLRLFISDPRSLGYNLSGANRMPVALDPHSAARAHLMVINRHDVLRSAYRQDDPTNPVRTVARALPGGVRTMVCAREEDAHILQLMDKASAHQLGVMSMRCSVMLAHSNECPVLGVNMHHILSDADGMSMYFGELAQASVLLSAGYSEEAVAAALPRLPVQFVDFAYWQKSLESQGLLDGDLSYWYREVVSSTPPVVLDVPIDKPRPRVWYAVGAAERCAYENELLLPLSEVTGRATPMAVTCTNFAIVLSRMSGLPFMDVAIPFALRNMPALQNLIGNFLNMMPVRMSHDPSEPYSATLERVATSNVNVQRYSLGQFIQLVDATRKHFPVTDPARNPIYATMIDLVPNESGEPSTALSGVLDVFLFVNTRQGIIWSLDAVYNTTILEAQSVRAMLLHMQAIARQAARAAREPVPRALPSREEAQPAEHAEVELASLLLKVGILPHVVPLRSGWPVSAPAAAGAAAAAAAAPFFGGRGQLPAEYFGIRRAQRLKRHSGLELTADYPPAALQSLRPPMALAPPVAPAAVAAQSAAAVASGPAPKKAPDALAAPAAAASAGALGFRPRPRPGAGGAAPAAGGAAAAKLSPEQIAACKARRREVAARWAECQRASELIPLDADGLAAAAAAAANRGVLGAAAGDAGMAPRFERGWQEELDDDESDLQLLQRGRQLQGRSGGFGATGAGRGRRGA